MLRGDEKKGTQFLPFSSFFRRRKVARKAEMKRKVSTQSVPGKLKRGMAHHRERIPAGGRRA
jgi:hypothetical protein